MADYLKNVILSSGGHGAPAEVYVESEKKEAKVAGGAYPVSAYFDKPPILIQDELKEYIKEIEEAPTDEYVEIEDLYPTQKYLYEDKFKDPYDYMKPITVYKDDEGLKLVDGHHRCAVRKTAGHTGIKAKIYHGPLMNKVSSLPYKKYGYEEFLDFDEYDMSLLASIIDEELATSDGPCWDGYVQVGMKEKNGKMVPNCVPADEAALYATAGSKPAPKKDQIKGSDKNKKGSAATGKEIKFTDAIISALEKKAETHNKNAKDGRRATLTTLKAVYRRGAGAFSTSHRPDQNRNSWAMARVNAFLKLLKSGKPKNAKYVTDNDLLPASHPRSTKSSAAITAAADPCWDGYVQVGMKTKNGKRVPNCVPSSATISYLVESANSEFGESRHVSPETAYAVARKAVDKYDYLPDEELYDAVIWELQNFLSYATTGESEYLEDFSVYSEYLTEGHPSTKATLAASATWISGAPDLDEKSRDAIVTAFSETEDYLAATHSTTRLRALISSGELSVETLKQLKTIVEQYPKVD